MKNKNADFSNPNVFTDDGDNNKVIDHVYDEIKHKDPGGIFLLFSIYKLYCIFFTNSMMFQKLNMIISTIQDQLLLGDLNTNGRQMVCNLKKKTMLKYRLLLLTNRSIVQAENN